MILRLMACAWAAGGLAGCEAADDPCGDGLDVTARAACARAACEPPSAPLWAMVPVGTRVVFPEGALIAVRSSGAGTVVDEAWRAEGGLTFEHAGSITVEARWQEALSCGDPRFLATYRVVDAMPAADEAEDADDAIAKDDARIVAWASRVVEADWGTDLDAQWTKVEKALGPATGAWDDAVSLGNGGALTVGFDAPFGDGPGPDFAVFENAFSPAFLELGMVEVSSDGEHWARFATLSTQATSVGPYGQVDASEVMGVAGRYAGGYGTAFDLAVLAWEPEVLAGEVDLEAIAFVKVVDLIGDGATQDALGHALYDPTPTFGPAGFDLEAVGVLGAIR
ncbi:MAG: hypothetical protein JNJ59_03485 [Deltaproteobacteria bacterium]|nr:hypothetical protein [Deltaproteobacteria bacterium]